MQMNKFLIGTSLLLVICLVSGCDFLRTVAGRPTSEEIEWRTLEIQKIKSSIAAAANDSTAVKEAADTLKEGKTDTEKTVSEKPAVKSTAVEKAPANTASAPQVASKKLSGSKLHPVQDVPAKYMVIVGSFSVKANADKLVEQFLTKGYKATALPFSNGLTAVGVGLSETRAQLDAQLLKLKDEPLCPKDAWVLINE